MHISSWNSRSQLRFRAALPKLGDVYLIKSLFLLVCELVQDNKITLNLFLKI